MRSIHLVHQHRSAVAGIEAMSLLTDRSFPRHSHDQFGIGVMASGAHRSWSGIGAVEAEAGDVIAVNPGEVHDGMPVSGAARGWRMLYLDAGVMDAAMGPGSTACFEVARPAMRDQLLAGSFDRLFATLIAPCPEPLAWEEAVARMLGHLARHHGATGPGPREPAPSVAQAKARLDAAPEDAPTLGELAALSGVSRFQLLRGFAKEVGITPHAYVVQRRVCLARRCLADGLGVAEAAAAAGFADQSHLTRCFVRQLGVTPARYRAALARP